ncbi:MAG: hypothetical protein IKW82_00650 [Bacteroidales bacterium]|nr:hypothetical protein [Bacteroidales bacterium]
MKKILWLLAAILITSCSKNSETFAQTMEETIYITIGEETHTVTMENNVGTRALVAALQTDNITYMAHDYGNFEKVGYVGQSFPTADHQITTSAGDLVLYNGDNICIFYGSNSWSYTRIGKLDNLSADEVRRFVKAGEGEVTITLSLQPIYTGIQELSPDENREGTTYTITGQIAPKGYKGIVIQNGKKRINH